MLGYVSGGEVVWGTSIRRGATVRDSCWNCVSVKPSHGNDNNVRLENEAPHCWVGKCGGKRYGKSYAYSMCE